MIIEFATKRDINGNRYFLGIDYESKTFARERAKLYGREDIIEISKKDRRKLIDILEKQGFIEVNYLKGGMM